jgi:hypothetical protein
MHSIHIHNDLTRKFRPVALFAIWACLSGHSAYAAELLNNPDPATLTLLQDIFSQTAPAYDVLAACDATVRAADEFHMPGALTQAEARLKARFDSLHGVAGATVNMFSTFAEYDSQYGEYDLDINDGSYISAFNACGRDVRIALTNGTTAQTWKLGSADAEQVLRKNHAQRGVTLALRLAFLASPPASDGEPIVLNAKIVGYDVLAGFNNVRLGTVVVRDGH